MERNIKVGQVYQFTGDGNGEGNRPVITVEDVDDEWVYYGIGKCSHSWIHEYYTLIGYSVSYVKEIKSEVEGLKEQLWMLTNGDFGVNDEDTRND